MSNNMNMGDQNQSGDEDETRGPAGPGGDDGNLGSSGQESNFNSGSQTGLRWDNLKYTLAARRVDFAMWITRMLTLIFGLLYIFPCEFYGWTHASLYYKAFLASAATSALRLHQRVPVFAFNRSYIVQLVAEDAAHYLLYCIVFIFANPISFALIAVELFALLHFASFTLVILDALGSNSGWFTRLVIALIEFQSVTILRVAAAAEIINMVFVVVYSLFGKASIVAPFVYYRFLTFRYASRRNHYSRTMFREFRILLETFAGFQYCPQPISNLIHKTINGISQLAPAMISEQPAGAGN